MKQVTMQELSDVRLNPYAVELLVESYKRAGPEAGPVAFEFAGVEITLKLAEPQMQIHTCDKAPVNGLGVIEAGKPCPYCGKLT